MNNKNDDRPFDNNPPMDIPKDGQFKDKHPIDDKRPQN